jgi:hypothetical protein
MIGKNGGPVSKPESITLGPFDLNVSTLLLPCLRALYVDGGGLLASSSMTGFIPDDNDDIAGGFALSGFGSDTFGGVVCRPTSGAGASDDVRGGNLNSLANAISDITLASSASGDSDRDAVPLSYPPRRVGTPASGSSSAAAVPLLKCCGLPITSDAVPRFGRFFALGILFTSFRAVVKDGVEKRGDGDDGNSHETLSRAEL